MIDFLLKPVAKHFPSDYYILAMLLLVLELALSAVVIWRIAYTEIDWIAYMQEVRGVWSGELDYVNLKGDTGPLVYPGAFVWLYSALYFATNFGANILLAQLVFAVLLVANLAVLLSLFWKSEQISLLSLCLLVASRRLHSIFVLRLFNDCWAMFFAFVAIYSFAERKWLRGCVFFSLGVGVKMNILLFAPGLVLLLLWTHGWRETTQYIFVMGVIQVLIGLPFLLCAPMSYLWRSFELGRQFTFKWSVNWQFLPLWIFEHRAFALGLLLAHIALLLLFLRFKWLPALSSSRSPTRDDIIHILFTSNLIGVVCARSLHYQFYSWYFFTLPYITSAFVNSMSRDASSRWAKPLLWSSMLALIGVIELCWNVYPPDTVPSLTLTICHLVLLYVAWRSFAPVEKLKSR